MPDIDTDLARLFEEAAAAKLARIEPSATAGVWIRVHRDDYNVDLLDHEDLLPAPRRATGTVAIDETASFIAYVNRHAGTDTVVYVDPRSARAIAVFNDHQEIATIDDVRVAGWRDLRARLIWRKTDAWKHWTKFDRQMLTQENFAEHIEDGLAEIVSPAAADLLEIAQTFKASMATEVRSARYLKNGRVAIAWNETIDAVAGRDGELTIPDHIELAVAPFEGAVARVINARLRYRLKGRELTLGYLLDRPAEFERVSIDAELEHIHEGITEDVVIVIGAPEATA